MKLAPKYFKSIFFITSYDAVTEENIHCIFITHYTPDNSVLEQHIQCICHSCSLFLVQKRGH